MTCLLHRLRRLDALLRSALRRPGFWAWLSAAVFLGVQLTLLEDFGLSFDESAGMKRGRNTAAFIVDLASGRFDAVDGTSFHPHPSFYATCNYIASEGLIRFLGLSSIPAGHVLNVLVSTAGLLLVFYLGRHLFNDVAGLVALLFLALYPRFAAHAHYNAKDVPLMAFVEFAVLFFYLAMTKGRLRYWVMAALGTAWSVATKLDGLFLAPIFLATWLIWRFHRSDPSASAAGFKEAYLFAALSIVFILIFWPALWLDPLHLVRSVFHFTGEFNTFTITYLGNAYRTDDVPWHFMPVHLLATTPLAGAGLFLLGGALAVKRWSQRKGVLEYTLLGCWIAFPLMARMTSSAVQYDGMRHVFLTVPALALLAGAGADQLALLAAGRARLRRWSVPVLGLLLPWTLWQSVQTHPFQGSYLNEAVRVFIQPKKLGDYFDFYSWGTPLKAACEWLNKNAPSNSVVAVPDHFSTLRQYPLRNDIRFQKDLPGDFVVVMGWRKDLQKRFRADPVFTATCHGAPLLLIYSFAWKQGSHDITI